MMVVAALPGDEALGFGGAIATGGGVRRARRARVRHPRLVRRALGRQVARAGGKNRVTKFDAVTGRNLDTVREDELRRSVSVLACGW